MPKAIRDMIEADLVCIGSDRQAAGRGTSGEVGQARGRDRKTAGDRGGLSGIRAPSPARPFGKPSWRLAGRPNTFVNGMGLSLHPDPGLISCFQE